MGAPSLARKFIIRGRIRCRIAASVAATAMDGRGSRTAIRQSYWKSNPYLTKAFTGEDDSLHPQWVMIDLGTKIDLNAIRIAWAEPYAKRYSVQFWTGELEPFYDGTTKGTWQTYPLGNITDGKGGTVTLKLVSWMIPVRYIRIWMTESSNTCDSHGSADKRNCVGYAINELYAGALSADGAFNDYVTHFPSRDQTITWPSSVDPWTASTDLDESRGDQVGFDFFFNSGVTRGLPTMVPIAMLYATPEDAANEIAYLYKRHYPISWIEMGEEADGQHMLPEDYGALYVQFATAIHKLVPEAKLGGPPFEGTFGDVEVWPDANGKVSWLGRFVDYLKAHGRLNDFTFLLVRALSVSGPAFVFVGRSVSRAGIREPRRASLERQRAAAEYSVLHDRREHWRRGASVDREKRAVAGGLRRHDDELREPAEPTISITCRIQEAAAASEIF